MFRKISSSTSYVDYVDKGMYYSQTFYMDSISMMLLLLKILFVFKVSRYINWIFLTLERVSNQILTYYIGDFDDFNIFSRFNALLWRLCVYCVPDFRPLRVHLPHL